MDRSRLSSCPSLALHLNVHLLLQVAWVPHAWLIPMVHQKLKNFLEKGPSLDLVTDETLAAKGDDMVEPNIARVMEEDDRVHGQKTSTHHATAGEWEGHGPAPDVNAESSIPMAWRVSHWVLLHVLTHLQTIDRVLDVMLLPPPKTKKPTKKKAVPSRRTTRIMSESASSAGSQLFGSDLPKEHKRPDGLEPPWEERIEIDEWERRAGRILTEGDTDEIASMVTWCFVSKLLRSVRVIANCN